MAIKKKKKEIPEFNIKQRFDNVKTLFTTNRPKEAISYIYRAYNALIENNFQKPRLPHQTIREYAMICVNELSQNPESVYKFVRKIEDIIYGGVEPTKKEIEDAIGLFSKLYQEITNKTFQFTL